MLSITKEFKFDAAHKLFNPTWDEAHNKEVFGKCYNLHGHTFTLFVTVEGKADDSGMIINFTDLKKIVTTEVIDVLDHHYLNDVVPFVTTCENMIEWIYQKLVVHLPTITKLSLYETPTSHATLDKRVVIH